MKHLIGGFSSSQYRAYLIQDLKKSDKPSQKWVSYLKLSNYPVVAACINRIAYFIFSRFTIYPNNTFLFKKFKSHSFSEIKNKEEYTSVKEIFSYFKNCSIISKNELNGIEQTLNQVRDTLQQEEIYIPSPEKGQNKIQVADEDEEIEEVVVDPKKVYESHLFERFNFDPKITPMTEEKNPDILSKEPSKQNEEELDFNMEDHSFSSSQEECHSSSDNHGPGPDTIEQMLLSPVVSTLDFEPLEIDIEENDAHKAVSDFIKGFQSSDSIEVSQPASSLPDSEKTSRNDLVSSGGYEPESEEDFEEEEVISLPDNIEKIVTQAFLLKDTATINNLFNPKYDKQLSLYKKNLYELCRYEKKMRYENLAPADERLHDCMRKYDGAFERAWEVAFSESAKWHEDFKSANPEPIQLGEDGKIICTTKQFYWIMSFFHKSQLPMHQLAFDAPSFGIHQKRRLAELARAIMIGPEACKTASPLTSYDLIIIKETIDKTTPKIESNGKHSLIKFHSFIYTHFIGPSGKLPQDGIELKRILQDVVRSYIRDWFKRDGTTLQFGNHFFRGGKSREGISSIDWIQQMRTVYTGALIKMTPERLKNEIQTAYDCFLIKQIVQVYKGEIEEKEWVTSAFPKALIELVFKESLDQTDPELQEAIRRTIDDATFERPEDVNMLAERAEINPLMIEALIRIRVFYIMCCLGQKTLEPFVRDLNQRVNSMYDPSVCETPSDRALTCHTADQRVLKFDETFDQLEITIKTELNDPNRAVMVATVESLMKVSSISQARTRDVKASIVELKNLHFSLYPLANQFHYLVAQVVPETLIENMMKLQGHISSLEIVKKAKQYHAEKDEYLKRNKGWLSLGKPFDSSPYKDMQADTKNLDPAVKMSQIRAFYLNTEQVLFYMGQWDENQKSTFETESVLMVMEFEKVFKMLEELYPFGGGLDKNSDSFLKKMAIFRELMKAEAVGLINSKSDATSSTRAPSPSSSKQEGLHVIGGGVKKVEKGLLNIFYDKTVGKFLNETQEPEYLKWKIERYETLITSFRSKILDYLNSLSMPVKQLRSLAKGNHALQWQLHLLPLFDLCIKEVRSDEDRLTREYLREVRNANRTMLEDLRKAATWAKEHPSMPGTEHVNALCYQLYTTIDINDCCQKIVNNFVEIGSKKLKQEDHPSIPNPEHAMITRLHDAHKKIQSVPYLAKAPLFDQLGNSLRGQLNGIIGITSFDPNMQSNPLHVLYSTLIEMGGKQHIIKDIAMGSPTIESGTGMVMIAPEFEATLRYYRSKKEVHLYINNQNYTSTSLIDGTEINRCEALHNLSEEEFKDTLYVITLSQNTVFYKQRYEISRMVISASEGMSYAPEMSVDEVKKGLINELIKGKSKDYLPAHLITKPELYGWLAQVIAEVQEEKFNDLTSFIDEEQREEFIQQFHLKLRIKVKKLLQAYPGPNGETFGYTPYFPGAEEFKLEFLAQLFDGDPDKTGNRIPADLVEKHDLREWSARMINTIHRNFFENRPNLTAEERRIFIRIVYQMLIRKIQIEIRADSCNTSCKDRIDRGAETDAEIFAGLAILAGCTKDEAVVDFFKMMVFGRAIIVRKRSIIEERLDRLVETVEFLLDHQEEFKELHNELFPGMIFTTDQFAEVDQE